MKQRQGKKDTSRLMNLLNDKTELIPGEPLLEIAGQCRVLIENHRGIIAYSPNHITVRVKFGTYHIQGCNLKIVKMGKDQLVILGRLETVQLVRGC